MTKMTTKLQDGIDVPKNSPILHAIGSVEELNASIGVVLAYVWDNPDAAEVLMQVQKDLITMAVDLQNPTTLYTRRLDNSRFIDIKGKSEEFGQLLVEPKGAIIPGGTPASAHCHLARAVCRRAERAVAELAFSADYYVNAYIGMYLNSLDHLLFALARLFIPSDTIWENDETTPEPAAAGTPEIPQQS